MKCKICGGTLRLLPGGDYECDSCGSVIRAADLAAKEEAGLGDELKKAQRLRENGDFSGAYLIYENIVVKHPTNAKARWNLVLCRYGVCYTFDELTGDYLPSVNRMRYDSILEDSDYLAALQCADSREKEFFAGEAKRISEIQKRYLKIAELEAPYDVFISFKAENPDKSRSRDSVIGQEIYNSLTEHGLRVFYSRITLEKKAGEEYEPYIFSALNTAKVMLLIGTRPEYVLAPWVANEWQRYLALIKEKRQGSLIPVFEGMAPEDFPKEIPLREALDYQKEGALSELVQGVLSITGKGVMAEANQSRSSMLKLSEGLKNAVEQGNFSNAMKLADAILNIDPENGDAYYYLLLAQFKVTKPTLLANMDTDFTASSQYAYVQKYGSPARKQVLEAVSLRQKMRIEDEKRKRLERDETKKQKEQAQIALSEAKVCMGKREYRKALDILQRRADKNEENQKLIEICKTGIKAQQLLSDKKLLSNRMSQEHPKEYFTARQKYRALATAERGENDDAKAAIGLFMLLICIVGMVVLAVVGSLMDVDTVNANHNSILQNLALIVGGIILLVLGILGYFGIRMILLGLNGYRIKKAYDSYLAKYITPAEDAMWEKIKQEYVPILGESMFAERPYGSDAVFRMEEEEE